MSPVTRMHHGRIQVDPTLLDDIDWALCMDTAEPHAVIAPLADRVRAHRAAFRNPWLDDELLAAVEARDDAHDMHDWLDLMEVDSVQRLRASLTADGTVDAALLSEVWNVLVGLGLSFEAECDGNPCCNNCDWCRFVLLTDRVSAVFDRAGFERPAYVDPIDYDPDAVWRVRYAGVGA